MFMTLFFKECGQVLKSLVYYIYVVVFVLFLTSQMGSEGSMKLHEPVPGEADYGMTVTHDKTQIMEKTLEKLVEEVFYNSFVTYPMGFYRVTSITDSEMEQAKGILERCTGKTFEALQEGMMNYYNQFAEEAPGGGVSGGEMPGGEMPGGESPSGSSGAGSAYVVSVKEGFTYEEFEAAMEEICRLVGKGSSYEKANYENRIKVPMTYEQAKEEYKALCTKDRLTRAYMRLFCDYAGIVLAILPIFVGVSRALRDKRAKVQQVLFSKTASGGQIIISRYLANLVMLCIPVAVTAFLLQQPYYYRAQTLGIEGDLWAFLTVPGVWLVPEIMTVLAVSFLVTECTDSILAVFVQVVWGIGSLFGAATLVGDFGLKLVARWNTLGQNVLFVSQERDLLLNRGYYALFAVVCVLLTVIVYERKRRMGGALPWKNTKI